MKVTKSVCLNVTCIFHMYLMYLMHTKEHGLKSRYQPIVFSININPNMADIIGLISCLVSWNLIGYWWYRNQGIWISIGRYL